MYDIHFRRHFYSKEDRTIIKTRIRTLKEANELRFVSGDLVVHSGTNDVVIDDAWLFPFEKTDENSHARKAINHAIEEKSKHLKLL